MENAFVGRHSRALAAGNPAPPNPSSHWDSCKSPCLFPIAPQGPDMTWQRLLTSDWLSSLFNASGSTPVSVTPLVQQLQSPWKNSVTLAQPEKQQPAQDGAQGKAGVPQSCGTSRISSPLPSITHLLRLNRSAWNCLAFLKIKGTPQSQGKAVTA